MQPQSQQWRKGREKRGKQMQSDGLTIIIAKQRTHGGRTEEQTEIASDR